MRIVTEADAMQSLPSLLQEVKTHSVVIRQGEKELGALVSMEDYEIVRRAKAEKFLRVSDELGEQIRSRAAEDGLTPDALMKFLDRKAS